MNIGASRSLLNFSKARCRLIHLHFELASTIWSVLSRTNNVVLIAIAGSEFRPGRPVPENALRPDKQRVPGQDSDVLLNHFECLCGVSRISSSQLFSKQVDPNGDCVQMVADVVSNLLREFIDRLVQTRPLNFEHDGQFLNLLDGNSQRASRKKDLFAELAPNRWRLRWHQSLPARWNWFENLTFLILTGLSWAVKKLMLWRCAGTVRFIPLYWMSPELGSCRDAHVTKALEEYRSPTHKIIAMLHAGRDKLRLKYAALRVELRTAQNQVRAVEASRATWRRRAEDAELQLASLKKSLQLD
jgi:hypothetical protein